MRSKKQNKGPFNNYLDQIRPKFDPPPLSGQAWTFYISLLQYGLFCYQIKYQCSTNNQLPMSIFFFMSTSLKILKRHDNKYSFISKSKGQGIWVKSEKAGDWRVVVCFCIALLCCRREEPNSSHYTDRKSTLLEFYDKKNPKCKP